MKTHLNPGDRVEVTQILKGGFLKGRFPATVIGLVSNGRIKVKDKEGKERSPFFINVRKLTS